MTRACIALVMTSNSLTDRIALLPDRVGFDRSLFARLSCVSRIVPTQPVRCIPDERMDALVLLTCDSVQPDNRFDLRDRWLLGLRYVSARFDDFATLVSISAHV